MKRSSDVAIDEQTEFASLLQNELLLRGLERSGYEQPSPIQLKVIPVGRLGVDIIAQAKSGTGKTVVFGVLALEAVDVNNNCPQVVIVAPTREIAVQICDVIRGLGHFMPSVKCHAFIGGLSMQADSQNLASGCHVVVGTPGRLMALLESKKLNTDKVKLFVLDEADKMMSSTFRPQVQYIFSKLKQSRQLFQCVAFSATFTDELMNDLLSFMKEPRVIRLTDGVPTLNEVQQYYTRIDMDKDDSTLVLYQKKFTALEKILSQVPYYQCMIFVNSLYRSAELSNWLNEMGWKSGHIHAGLSQDERLLAMEQMRDFKIRILVCSDLIARGIDVDRVNLVINVDIPWDIETYLHRIGRTGRYGTSGIAVSLIGREDESFLEDLQNKGVTIDQLPDKVAHSEYIKQLTETEQSTLTEHNAIQINPKPIQLKRLKKEEAAIRKQKNQSKKQKVESKTSHTSKQPIFSNDNCYPQNQQQQPQQPQQPHKQQQRYPQQHRWYPQTQQQYPQQQQQYPQQQQQRYPQQQQQQQYPQQQQQQQRLPFIPPDLFF